ncbi:MAG: M14 family metallopeptidase [Gemmatimonadetes bacterium]|nr:M14 family metallopeptidase [Gemmatimonadota bacterium]MDA1103164.1 M14 family metallopeptidase [Gemmatimonadota bacterium]
MPKLSCLHLLALVLALAGALPVSSQSELDALLTRAERTDFAETSSYADVIEMVERLAALSDDIHLTSFGYTNEGRRLPLLVVGAPDASPESVRATGKTRVYLQGNIHAGEVCGKEALLMLLRDFARGQYPDWTDDLVLIVAPIYNADGNERVDLGNRPRQHGPIGGMGQRPNAQGLDLNRDHMKLDSPEARSVVGMMNAYDPHVSVDLHTTNGTRHAYRLTYSPPLHPNTPMVVDHFLRDAWLPAVTERIKEKRGWDYYYYGNHNPRRPGWYTFDYRPRFNNNYIGLRNRMAILSEAYAYDTFEDRVSATLWFVEEVLGFAQENAREIRSIVEEAELRSVVGQPLATRATFEQSAEEVTILMGEVDEERHPSTGEIILRRREVAIPTSMFEFGTFVASETSIAPEVYYVRPEAADAIDRLRAHGVTMVPLAAEQQMALERFRIDSTTVAPTPFQGRSERTLHGAWVASIETLPAGTVAVPVDQSLGRLAFTLLEPRSDDGLANWAIFDPQIGAGSYPVLRAPSRR